MLNIVLQIISMVLCAVGLLQIIVGSGRRKLPIRYYVVFYLVLFLYAGMVLTGLLLEGQPGVVVNVTLNAVCFIKAFCAYYLSYIVVRAMLRRIDPQRQNKRMYCVSTVILIAQMLLYTAVHISGICIKIDEENHTVLLGRYEVLITIWLPWIVFAVYLVARYHSKLKRKNLIVLCLLILASISAIILQSIFESVYFATLAAAVEAVIITIGFVSDMAQQQLESQREIDKLKTDIMLSQIQPHFLYNSLTAIKHLIRTDPSVAENAISEFAVFLRGNMDSLSSDTLIPFRKELEHTKAYLDLEKLRFGDELTIVEQIGCASFKIPALTLQPVVENAVRHGVRGTEDGKGTVMILTKEFHDRYEITVTDNGNGFDTKILDGDDNRHLGIRNVRYRLEHMAGGSLTYESAVEQGTAAVIALPKQPS